MPLIVGGTGLYLRALIDGLADIPPEKPEVRQQLQSDLDALGVAAMHARLAEVDETAALRLRPTDAQRIMRALAVFESTGRPLSEWQSQASPQPSFNCPVFVLDMERRKLREALTERFHAMLDAGWLDEVRWLASLDLSAAHPALRAVGYRQLLAHVRGACSLAEAVKAGITATHRYAKRQITWFRHQTQAEWGEAGSLRPRLMKALAA